MHLPSATAVIADVHLGYGEARHRGGEAVPCQGAATVLDPLRPMLLAHSVRRLVIAGDLFEAGPVASLVKELLAWSAEVGSELFAVVPGNHDRHLAAKAPHLPLYPDGVMVGRWHVVHGDKPLPDGFVIQGHEHPVARWGGQACGACYLIGERRIVVPAFSADAAGVNVLHDPRWGAFRCCVIAGEKILDFGAVSECRKQQIR